ncbi:MAG: hypothetical protein ACQXXL_03510 [Candidatus Methanosuratincola sp.]|jgi:hypothetical protein
MTSGSDYMKPMAAFAAATVAPIYAGLILSFAFPRYAVYSVAGGLIGTVLALFTIVMWSAVHYQGWAAIGLTLQHADGLDEYCDVLYTEAPRDLGKDPPYYRYSVLAVDGTEWLFMMDHPLEEVMPRYEKVPIGVFMPTVPTRFVTGILLQDTDVQLHEDDIKPSLWQRMLRRHPPEARKVRDVYIYGTPAAVKRLKQNGSGPAPAITAPDEKAVKALYGTWFDTEYNELKTTLNSVEQDLKDTMKMLDDRLPITLRVRRAAIEEREPGWGKTAKWAAVAALTVAGAFLALWWLGVV